MRGGQGPDSPATTSLAGTALGGLWLVATWKLRASDAAVPHPRCSCDGGMMMDGRRGWRFQIALCISRQTRWENQRLEAVRGSVPDHSWTLFRSCF